MWGVEGVTHLEPLGLAAPLLQLCRHAEHSLFVPSNDRGSGSIDGGNADPLFVTKQQCLHLTF